MVNHTIILECASSVLQRLSLFSHLQVLEGHLAIVSIKHLPIHKYCLCWPILGHVQIIAYGVGSFSLSIKRKFPVVRKYKRKKRKNETKCD